MTFRLGSAFLVCLFATLSPLAWAGSTFCCSDDRGRNICSDVLPEQCYGRAYREINDRGVTIRRVDAPLTAEQRAQKEAAAKKAREEQQKRMEQERLNRALLATYPTEADLDYARDRAVADVERGMQESQAKYDEALKRRKKLNDEAEFYKKKGLPPELQAQIRENDKDLKEQLQAVENKKKEMETVKARYAQEKVRYRELTGSADKPAGNAPAPKADTRPR